MKRRVAFFGSPSYALPCLEALWSHHLLAAVISQPDQPQGRGLALRSPPVAERARALGLPLFQPSKLRDPAQLEPLLAELAGLQVEVGVTCAYGQILPKKLLSALPYGVINAHASLLPRYRGAAPIQWALIRGERVSGVTLMQTEPGLDSGPVLLQRALAIPEGWDAVELSEALAQLSAELVIAGLDQLDALTPTPQDPQLASLAPKLSREDGRIRWEESAEQIVNRHRGVQPWPGSFTFWRGQRLKVAQLRAGPEVGLGESGEVLAVRSAGGVLVRAGTGFAAGSVELLAVQPESRSATSAAEWLRSHGAIGIRLG